MHESQIMLFILAQNTAKSSATPTTDFNTSAESAVSTKRNIIWHTVSFRCIQQVQNVGNQSINLYITNYSGSKYTKQKMNKLANTAADACKYCGVEKNTTADIHGEYTKWRIKSGSFHFAAYNVYTTDIVKFL